MNLINFLFWVGVILASVGVVGMLVTGIFAAEISELASSEEQAMRRDRVFPREPEFMGDFRVARASVDKTQDPLVVLKFGTMHFGPAFVVGVILLFLTI